MAGFELNYYGLNYLEKTNIMGNQHIGMQNLKNKIKKYMAREGQGITEQAFNFAAKLI